MSRYDAMIDHTNLRADACDQDMETLCQEARDHGFAMVAVNSVQSALCSALLAGTGVHTGAAIGFPLGQTTIAVKVFETRDAIANGADEIDMVINIGDLRAGDTDKVADEIKTLKAACGDRILKVIIETCLLTEEEKIAMCRLVTEAGADYIKTSTGFSTAGATFDDVALFARHVGPDVKIKAAGGISSFDDAVRFIELGAGRLGTSRIIKLAKNEKATGY